MLPLYTKALHLIFMVTWYAGLFYLPRLFIYHAETRDSDARERFHVMQKRLFAIMTIGAVLTFVFGIWTMLSPMFQHSLQTGWFKIKLVMLAGLILHHALCWRWIRRLRAGDIPPDTKWLRFFNEIPAIYLIVIIILAVTKPF